MKKTSSRGHSTLNELNITPLLDLVFVLLVIFIITTPQMVNSLEMALPSGKPPEADPNAPKPKINRIIVVVLTSSQNEQDIASAYAYGANAYLIKPVGAVEFDKVLTALKAFWLENTKFPNIYIEL